MSNQSIEVLGITPTPHFPDCSQLKACTQVCETDILNIPCNKPSMECPHSVCVSTSICSSKIICTPVGKKLVIEAIKHIKVMYIASDSCQSVHTTHFDIPFCLFILLEDSCSEVCDIFLAIEHISAKKIDCRSLSVSTILFACALFQQPICPPQPFEHCHDMTPKTKDHCHTPCCPPQPPHPHPSHHHHPTDHCSPAHSSHGQSHICPSCQKTSYGKNVFYGK